MAKKKRKWPWVVGICAGVGALAVWGISSVGSSFSQAARMSQYETAEAKRGTIESTVVGTGSLAYADAKPVYIPNGVDVTSVYCSPGDSVAEGDLLASVNRSECETAMSSTYQQISETDAKLESTSAEPETVAIKAPVAGRVVELNVSNGSSVLDATSQGGCLLLISPGGQMGAEIDKAADADVEPSESVTLHLQDGTQRTGTVESVEEDTFSVVLVDTNVVSGEAVQARDLSGADLGSGTLTALDGIPVVGPSGAVQDLDVGLNESVEAGKVLMKVKSSEPSAEYQQLQQERSSLTRRYDALSDIYQAGGLKAPSNGTIVSSNLKASEDDSSSSADSAFPFSAADASSMYGSGMGAFAGGMTGTSVDPGKDSPHTTSLGPARGGEDLLLSSRLESPRGGHDMLLASAPDDTPEDQEPQPDPEPEEPTQEPQPEPVETPEPEPSSPPATNPPGPTDQPDQPTASAEPSHILPSSVPTLSPIAIPALTVPLIPPIPTLPLQQRANVLPVYTGTVEWTPAAETAEFQTVYTARITLRTVSPFYFEPDCQVELLGTDPASVSVSEDGKMLTILATYPATSSLPTLEGIDWGSLKDVLGSILNLGDLSDLISSGSFGFDMSQLGGLGSLGSLDMSSLAGASALDMSALQGAAGLDMSALQGAAGMDMSALQGTAGQSAGYADSSTACTIASNDEMQLQIEINQMDILAVTPGMECRVTVDAIENGTFTGTVDEVSATAGSSGSYTVRITMEKTDEMRSGMTATAEITTGQSENVVSLPVDAVQEDGNRSFVYTSYGDEGFGGEVDVETGVSNGSTVEILSGLEEGQEVYYPAEDPMERMMRLMTAGEAASESVRSQAQEANSQ